MFSVVVVSLQVIFRSNYVHVHCSPVEELELGDGGVREDRPLDQVVVGLVPRRLRLELGRRRLPGNLDHADTLAEL